MNGQLHFTMPATQLSLKRRRDSDVQEPTPAPDARQPSTTVARITTRTSVQPSQAEISDQEKHDLAFAMQLQEEEDAQSLLLMVLAHLAAGVQPSGSSLSRSEIQQEVTMTLSESTEFNDEGIAIDPEVSSQDMIKYMGYMQGFSQKAKERLKK